MALSTGAYRALEYALCKLGFATEVQTALNLATLGVQPASGVAGVKIIGGEIALDGSNPTAVATGLTAITGASITLKDSAAPGAEPATFSYTSSGGTLSIYAWKPTAAGDTALIASTATDTVGYVVTGT
jgi:hypothetical protein